MIYTSAGVASMAEEDKGFAHFVQTSIGRYYECDWGETAEEECLMNDAAVENGDDRIIAVYRYHSDLVIWIITECDRSATTILFPYEY